MKIFKNFKVRLGLPVGEKDRTEILRNKFRNSLVMLWGFFLIVQFTIGCFWSVYQIYLLCR